MTLGLEMSATSIVKLRSPFSPWLTISLNISSWGYPILLCTVQDWKALSIFRLVAPANFLWIVSIMLIPPLCLQKSMYGIPLHTPISLLKTNFLPFGVVTTLSPFVWVDTMYLASSSMRTENRLAIQPHLEFAVPTPGVGSHCTSIEATIHGCLSWVHPI